MKFPGSMNTYCPKCRKHTKHSVSVGKKGKERTMNRGRRKYEALKKGYGGSPRTPKKQVYKVGKRVLLILKCSVCTKKHQKLFSARTKKAVEISSQ
jgi:large subunit ribosomal protein L44e